MNYFGLKLRDKIMRFEGICTGHATYISGCSQLLLVPPMQDGKLPESQWFDEQRCEPVDMERMVLENGLTPGCDRAAPKR